MKIIFFYVFTCNLCIVQTTILDRIKEDYPEVEIISVDADKEFDLVKKYSPTDTPELVFIQDNKEVDRIKGVAHKDDVEEIVKRFIT